MARLQPRNTTANRTQSITLTVHITGDQNARVDTHGGRGLGSNVVVLTDHIAIYTYDPSALATYANAWIDGGIIANHRLPEQAEGFGTGPEYTPGIIVRAHGRDEVSHTYDPVRQQMIIIVGQMRWLIHDRLAYRSMTAAWRQAKDVGAIVLARG